MESLKGLNEEDRKLVHEGFRNKTLDELQQALAEEKLKASMISGENADIVKEYDERKKEVRKDKNKNKIYIIKIYIYIYIYIYILKNK